MRFKGRRLSVLLAIACAAAFCLALAGCGGSGGGGSAPADQGQGAGTETAAPAANGDAAAPAASGDVSAEFKASCDEIASLADQMNKMVDEAIASGNVNANNDKIDEISNRISELASQLRTNQSSWTDAEKAYFNETVMPALDVMSNALDKMLAEAGKALEKYQ